MNFDKMHWKSYLVERYGSGLVAQ